MKFDHWDVNPVLILLCVGWIAREVGKKGGVRREIRRRATTTRNPRAEKFWYCY